MRWKLSPLAAAFEMPAVIAPRNEAVAWGARICSAFWMADLFAFKILTPDQYAQFKADGIFHGAAIDLADGYIHMSTRERAAETAAKHFAGRDALVMVMIDLAPLSEAVRWEPSRGGALFPHLYAPLPIAAVAGKVILRLDETGRHQFPAGF